MKFQLQLPPSITRDPKTTLTGLLGAVAVLVGHFGLHMSLESQGAIVFLMVFMVSLYSKDSS